MNIKEYLSAIDYPGRIVASGWDSNGKPVLLYAITARSENSRNRVLSLDGGILRTKPYDESKVKDPSLIIYSAMRTSGSAVILSNGDQTDTIAECISCGKSLEEALAARTYEPDAPNYTPRISAVMDGDNLSLSIIRKTGDETDRRIFRYEREDGVIHLIHTYMHDGDPLPSFEGLPLRLDAEDMEKLTEDTWSALSPERRVALYVRIGDAEWIVNAKEEEND